MPQWVIRSSDGVFLRDKSGEGLVTGEIVMDVVGAPDARTERYDATSPTGRRAATAPEIAAYDDAVLDSDARVRMDVERVFSALVWAILDTYSAPATVAKYQAARTKIIAAFKAQPWKS
jgi:hypothetical protein